MRAFSPCPLSAYPALSATASLATQKVTSSTQLSALHRDSPFVQELNRLLALRVGKQVVHAVDALQSEFRAVDNLVARNSFRVLKAFQNARVGSHKPMAKGKSSSVLDYYAAANSNAYNQHFGGSTGYGHDEAGGREALDQAFAEIVGAEFAIVRSQVILSFLLFSVFCQINLVEFCYFQLLAVAGAPYDTLEEVIGKRDSHGLGSLKDFGVTYRELPMQNPNCLVMVDNCYGEFVEGIEPPMVGADLMAGSLIKNPGGTIAPCGGYVAGKRMWVEAAAARLSAPGLGTDCGSTPGDIMRAYFQGLYLSPQMVGEAIKGTFLIAEVMASKGFKVQPLPCASRHDTVQAVQLGNRERLLAFCEAVQRSSPVGSFTKPVAGSTPGYASEVIFADGTFIDGSTSELSCDGPLREPFAVYCQGGTHWTQWGIVLGEVLKHI
ncbi:unnamed protein product [Linum tenue]|uniref:Aluminum resistance protein n=1 Tax=Linum tenue TaxID=586396 RepID=A0AAV0LYR2_9ROSI|nr:unnamed protein product [Linum tenue]